MKKNFLNQASIDLINNIKIFQNTAFELNLLKISKIVNKCINSQNKILTCGNGGSATQASHFSTELIARFKKKYKRNAHNSIALGSDMSLLTAIGNDYGFDNIFSRQIEGIGKKKDLLILFSTSGNSKNLIKAVKKASSMKLKTISITGNSGGKLKKLSNLNINIPSNDTARIQECHLFIIHLITELVEIENKK